MPPPAHADTDRVMPSSRLAAPQAVPVSEILAALSFALDLTEGQPMGHTLRSCLIGMELGERIGLPLGEQRDLYYALLLKDVGCSSNSARVFELFGGDEHATKQDLKSVDWANYFKAARYAVGHAAPGESWLGRARRIAKLARVGARVANELVETRCATAIEIIGQFGFGTGVSGAVASLDEHWDGRGAPHGLRGSEIPILARVMNLAQTLEVFASADDPHGALQMVGARSGKWFDPLLVSACEGMEEKLACWCAVQQRSLSEQVREREPGDAALLAGSRTLDRIALGFARVVDSKSPYTGEHSLRVTELALRIAGRMGFDDAQLTQLKRAGLLHDLGKLSVPNSILDKPGPLTPEEWEAVKLHPYYTELILDHIRGFEHLSFVAASHHERLDGNGYWRGLRAEQVPMGSQVLAAADQFDALSAARPYRPAMPQEVAQRLIEKDRGASVGGECLDALAAVLEELSPGDTEPLAA